MASYYGKICAKHPELDGLRRNGNCPACERERKRSPEYQRRNRAWKKTSPKYREMHRRALMRWRERNREHYLSIANANRAKRRARQKEVTIDPNASREYARLRRLGKRLGLVVDHATPIAGCRVCGRKGAHDAHNFQLLPPRDNERKGNRCTSCWLSSLMPSERRAMRKSLERLVPPPGFEPGTPRSTIHKASEKPH